MLSISLKKVMPWWNGMGFITISELMVNLYQKSGGCGFRISTMGWQRLAAHLEFAL